MITKRFPRGLYSPEALEPRIAPATIIVDSLLDDNGAGTTLREAIVQANGTPAADTIIFKGAALEGEIALALGELVITESLTIKGPGAGKLIIDAGDTSRIFKIDDGNSNLVKTVSISGLSMVEGHGVGAESGGGIHSRESLTLTNVVVSGCVAAAGGGGIDVSTAGKLVIKNSIISGNSTTGGGIYHSGGGLYAVAGAGIQIVGSTIFGNTADKRGGGVNASIPAGGTGDILIDASTIVGNTGTDGGGLSLSNLRNPSGTLVVGKVTVKNCRLSGNSAATEGGGLFLDDGVVTLDRVTLSNNTAAITGGGAASKSVESLTIKSSTVTHNRTTNGAAPGGGGIYVQTVGKVVIQSSIISGNTSASDGGGIASYNSTVLLKSTTVSGNTASDDGGGLFGTGGGAFTVESSLFFANLADQGGGLHTEGTIADAVQLTIKSSTFRGNRAASSGGGMDTAGDGAVSISRSIFIGNATVGDAGGAMYLRSSAAIVITSSTIVQNAGGIGAGGVALAGTGPKSIVGTLIRDNFAITGDGGGIGLFGTGILTLSKTTSVMYNAALGQGGGVFNGTADAAKLLLNGSKVLSNTAPTDPQISGPSTP